MPTSNPNAPFGLRAIRRIDSASWGDSMREYYVPAANTNALFDGDPVLKVSGLADANGINAIDIAVGSGGTASLITGVVGGFRPNYALSGTPGPAYRPAATSLAYYAMVSDDPEVQFIVRDNGNYGGTAGTATPMSAVGKNANLIAGAGSPYTGYSGWALDANTIATTATLQVNIVGFLQEPDNVPLAPYAQWIVRLNKVTEIQGAAGI
jgi:hypothetical protein